jgi:GntR family transcriptional regulator
LSASVNVTSIARRFSESSFPGVDRLPKYLRLSNAMLDAIVSGEFTPGSQIPGERNLSAVLPLSLGTIQRAMNNLVEQGVVFRRAGMGTFVAGVHPDDVQANDDKVARRDLVHFRFHAEGSDELLPVYLHVDSIREISRSNRSAGKPWQDFLEGGKSFVRIDRRLDVGDSFSAYCRFYLPGERYASLLRRAVDELNGVTLREILNRTYNMATLRFKHRIQTEELPAGICQKLEIERGSYGTIWHIFGHSYRNVAASYQVVYLPVGHRPIELLEKLE